MGGEKRGGCKNMNGTKDEMIIQAVEAQQLALDREISTLKVEIQAYKKQVTQLQTSVNEMKKMVDAVSADQNINVNELLQVLMNISKPVNITVYTDDAATYCSHYHNSFEDNEED